MTAACERFEWIVGPDEARTRLDRFLSGREGIGTRSQIQRLIRDGLVRVGGRAVKASTVLRAGQEVTVERPRAELPSVEPEAIPLEVLYEDEVVMVINKPAGLVVHPAPGHWRGTVVNALLHRWRFGATSLMPAAVGAPSWRDRSRLEAAPATEEGEPVGKEGEPMRLGIVHRLDKDTSGALVIAKTIAALEDLGRQFRRREISKQYLALAWGRFERAHGVIKEPIARHRVHRKRMAVQPHGREAVTRYEVVERFADVTLVRAFPETGRTHQIRVHLAAIAHPIVGDAEYGGRRRTSLPIRRQALHAEVIVFRHPVRDERILVTAPLPEDFNNVLAALRQSPLTSPTPFSSVGRQCTPRKGV